MGFGVGNSWNSFFLFFFEFSMLSGGVGHKFSLDSRKFRIDSNCRVLFVVLNTSSIVFSFKTRRFRIEESADVEKSHKIKSTDHLSTRSIRLLPRRRSPRRRTRRSRVEFSRGSPPKLRRLARLQRRSFSLWMTITTRIRHTTYSRRDGDARAVPAAKRAPPSIVDGRAPRTST